MLCLLGSHTLRSMQAWWTTSSMWSVVTPGRTSRAAISKTSLASRQTFLIPSCSSLFKTVALCRPTIFCSDRGKPSL